MLLDAARRLVIDVGPGVPLSTVAAQAGVGIGTLYRHFPTRDELLAALVADTRQQIYAIVERYVSEWNSAPVKAWKAFATELSGLALSTLRTEHELDPRELSTTPRIDQLRTEGLADINRLLTLAKRAGLVGVTVEPDRFLVGLATVGRPLAPHVLSELRGQPEWLIDVYLRGLRDA